MKASGGGDNVLLQSVVFQQWSNLARCMSSSGSLSPPCAASYVMRCTILANGGRTVEVRAKALTTTPASGASFLEASTKSYPASFLWVKTLGPICGSVTRPHWCLFLKVLLWKSGIMRPFDR